MRDRQIGGGILFIIKLIVILPLEKTINIQIKLAICVRIFF